MSQTGLSVRLTSFRFVVVDAIATVAIYVATVDVDAVAATAAKNLRVNNSRFAS